MAKEAMGNGHFPCQNIPQDPGNVRGSLFLSQIALKSSRLALLGSGPGQSITSTVSWASSALQG